MPFAQLARRTAERLGRAFEAQGRPSPWQPTAAGEPDSEPLSLEQPVCSAATRRPLGASRSAVSGQGSPRFDSSSAKD